MKSAFMYQIASSLMLHDEQSLQLIEATHYNYTIVGVYAYSIFIIFIYRSY